MKLLGGMKRNRLGSEIGGFAFCSLSLSQLEVWSFLRRLFSALRMEFQGGHDYMMERMSYDYTMKMMEMMEMMETMEMMVMMDTTYFA